MENAPTNVQGIITQQVNRAKTQKAKTPAQLMQSIVNAEGSKALLENSLKENSGAFAASVIDLYASDTYLQNCAPQAVFAEVLKAVSLKLPINKQLGFAYIIPRRDHGVWKPVFQLGYKGYIQLCMRTGAYRYINADTLMFIQAERSQQSMSNGNSVDVKLFIAKNRHGESGFVPFRWQPQYHRYVAISDRGESQ